ncbi:MAG TPA: HAD-IIIA family hydrolase [Victivallales bacterium]|nr:HAD-IIIA family hydrolase [Victivallales bacterium]
MNIKEKTSKIKAIILDVDGVLTDGKVGYSSKEEEIKFFNIKDGLGISLALKSGLKVGVLSGRSSSANKIRAKELKLSFLYEGEKNKETALFRLLKEHSLLAEECLYIGDDLIDIPVMKKVGIAIAVGDAVDELDEVSDFRTKAFGGNGAVREAIVWLLKETCKWNDIVKSYM